MPCDPRGWKVQQPQQVLQYSSYALPRWRSQLNNKQQLCYTTRLAHHLVCPPATNTVIKRATVDTRFVLSSIYFIRLPTVLHQEKFDIRDGTSDMQVHRRDRNLRKHDSSPAPDSRVHVYQTRRRERVRRRNRSPERVRWVI